MLTPSLLQGRLLARCRPVICSEIYSSYSTALAITRKTSEIGSEKNIKVKRRVTIDVPSHLRRDRRLYRQQQKKIQQNASSISQEKSQVNKKHATIYALSSAGGRAGVAVIRVSGPDATQVSQSLII